MIANLAFDIPAEERAFMRAARADELYECLIDIQAIVTANNLQPQPWDDTDAVSKVRYRIKRLKQSIGDLG